MSQLKLVLWKNYLIRRRHLFLTVSECLIPILLFMLIAYGRSKISGLNKQRVEMATYNDFKSQDLLSTQNFPHGYVEVWYSPRNTFYKDLMAHLQQHVLKLPSSAITGFSSETELLNHYTKNPEQEVIIVNFKGNNTKVLDYDVRIHDKFLNWDTNELFYSTFQYLPGMGSEQYILRGFAALQLALDTSFIAKSMNVPHLNVSLTLQEFPYPPHNLDSALNDLFIHYLPLITIFSFIFLCPAVLKRVAEEKYSGIKELMRMVGMKSWMLWLGWLIHALVVNLVSIGFIVFFMKVPLWGASYPAIEHCQASVLFVFLVLYCIASIVFCFFISSLFNRPTIAMVFGILIWILTYFIPKAVITKYAYLPWLSKILFGFFPNMALHYGFNCMSVFEMREIGISWTNLFQSASGGSDDITMGQVFLTLVMDSIIYMVLVFYIENIKPGQYGLAKPFYYPISAIVQLFKRKVLTKSSQIEDERMSLNNVEEGQGLKVGIQVTNLYKKYDKNVAVDGLTMNIYQNQITVLLGHNGAGKTTTMSMITGMIAATKGMIRINGYNIKDNINKVRKSMGLCPQHNLLFPDLTVAEHLQFFAMLKGSSFNGAKQEAIKLLKTLNIYEKRSEMAQSLSGGMKRKLCLGMSIIGDSQVLILDEPTSGMDPESRREIWDLLLSWRKSKTILITTHFMEEADVLGDWIAIMANGRLQCYGTPMYLKKKYATGYHLSLVLDSNELYNKYEIVKEIDKIIKENIENAEFLRENGCNLVFMLPFEEKHNFAKLFNILDNNLTSLKINNVSLTVTTLEEVFLKAKSEIETQSENGNIDKTLKDLRNSRDSLYDRLAINANNVRALMLKRFYFLMGKFPTYLPAILTTILITLLAIHLGQSSSDYYESGGPELKLNLKVYGETSVFFSGANDDSTARMKNFYGATVRKQKSVPIEVSHVSEEIIKRGIENIAYYKQHMIVAAEFNKTNTEIVVNAMYSNNAIHGAPISINLVTNAILKSYLSDDYSIKITNKPLETINAQYSPNEQSEVQVGILWLILVTTGLLFLMGTFIIFPNCELSTKFTELQLMCGISPTVYWFSNWLFDYLTYLLIITIKIIAILIVTSFYTSPTFGINDISVLFIILMAYGLPGIPFSYMFSYKETIAGGFALLLMFGMFISVVPTVIIGVLEASMDEYYENIGNILKHVFLCTCPHFSVTFVLVKFARKAVRNHNWLAMASDKRKLMCSDLEVVNPCCKGDTLQCKNYKSYFGNHELGISCDLAEMLIGFCIYFFIIVFLNSVYFKIVVEYFYVLIRMIKGVRIRHDKKGRDELQLAKSLFVNKLQKYYKDKKVVDNMSFNVKNGECYGLLGVNGAGKTTTFKMLTRELIASKGDVAIRDKTDEKVIPITEKNYLTKIGYCPQFEALNFDLTAKQLLMVFALIRGHPYDKEKLDKLVDNFITIFDLVGYKNKPCGSYSGGNKRKLSLALAFIGLPQNILLDEPTSGVDPASRRKFWNTLSNLQKLDNTSFILSSHSMEECEVLCNRFAIMKDGKKNVEGTLPELKEQFKGGYTVVFKIKPHVKNSTETIIDMVDGMDTVDSSADIVDGRPLSKSFKQPSLEGLKCAISRQFQTVELKDEHTGQLQYHVKDSNKNWSAMFEIVEMLRKNHEDVIEDYCISETSLEDIFLSVARL